MRAAEDRAAELQKDIAFLKKLPEKMGGFFVKNLEESFAQLHQDLFVLWEVQQKKSGFFVEVGACDGLLYSNTALLEKKYGWGGLLVEPAHQWHASLRQNRQSQISHDFVGGKSGELIEFCEADEGEFSSAVKYADSDRHSSLRQQGQKYQVETISLGDLFRKYSVPSSIDYLSLDTEGSELEILQGFDFQGHHIRCITCEHNFTARREEIHGLLARQGYIRKYEEFSFFDDWYFKP